MKFTIEEFTNPLTADILNRKDFSFASGSVGGAITSAEMQAIMTVAVGAIIAQMNADNNALIAKMDEMETNIVAAIGALPH